ncbi:hypothetical protein BDZ89DRAFT_1077277 [Hymenopellis radicata]|nr:hypothetical protein BDZ89DRAFT_1077277 [Hymenopellis radicata]
MFASSLNFNITHLHILSPKSRSNESTRVVGERRPIQKRKSSLNLRAQYHNIESARDVARTEPEATIHDAYVVVL